jgi:transcriptional regulator with XRE-family HTH domain
MEPTELGALFRSLRIARGLSLTQVADATDMSASFVSLFETGKSDITFARLVRLVAFFRIRLADLFPGDDLEEIVVVRAKARERVESDSEHAILELLTDGKDEKLGAVLITLEPGGTIEPGAVAPGRVTFIFVVRGAIEVDDGLRPPIRLAKGDSTSYIQDRGRRFLNAGKGPAEWITVTTPPSL